MIALKIGYRQNGTTYRVQIGEAFLFPGLSPCAFSFSGFSPYAFSFPRFPSFSPYAFLFPGLSPYAFVFPGFSPYAFLFPVFPSYAAYFIMLVRAKCTNSLWKMHKHPLLNAQTPFGKCTNSLWKMHKLLFHPSHASAHQIMGGSGAGTKKTRTAAKGFGVFASKSLKKGAPPRAPHRFTVWPKP